MEMAYFGIALLFLTLLELSSIGRLVAPETISRERFGIRERRPLQQMRPSAALAE
jgi:hypothetical protein